jgi:hypothetical protein
MDIPKNATWSIIPSKDSDNDRYDVIGEKGETAAAMIPNKHVAIMIACLPIISVMLDQLNSFMTPEEIRENDIGLGYEEYLEMAYENMQGIIKYSTEIIDAFIVENTNNNSPA